MLAFTASTSTTSSLTGVSRYLDALAARGEFSGNVLIARRGEILFQRSYEKASVEFGIRNTPDTRFRIFSTTKQIIATAILQLAARRELDLNESVTSRLPELPKEWKAATIRQVLLHTSGIPNDEPIWAQAFEQSDARSQVQNLEAIAGKLAGQPLATKPGSAWKYNNFGYDLLGCIIERVTRRNLAESLQQTIFIPAGMRDTLLPGRARIAHTMYSGNAVVPGLAYGYNGVPGRLETADPQMYASAAAGGIVTTARDLMRYDNALSAGVLLPKEWEAAAVSQAFPINSRASYGFGWIVVHTSGGESYVHHSGGSNGYTSDYVRVPSDGLCVIILSNFGFAPAEDKMRNRILETLLGSSFAVRK